MTKIEEMTSINLTILSIMADMKFKDNEERKEFAIWASDWVTPAKPPSQIRELKGMN